MKAQLRELCDISAMTCSACGKPFDITIIESPAGQHETYLQCFTCLYSIKLSQAQPQREVATIN